jgi:flagellar biogenesis protein FliO
MRCLPARRWPHLAVCCLTLVSSLHAARVSASDATIAGPVSLPASMPLRRESDTPVVGSAWVSALALLAVGGAGGAWWWRRKSHNDAGHRTRARAVQVVTLASRSLTPQASVHAIEWKGEELLVACTAQNVTVLSRRPLPEVERRS